MSRLRFLKKFVIIYKTPFWLLKAQEFTFNTDREIYGMHSMDLPTTDEAIDCYVTVLKEYKKMLTAEKSRRKLHQ